MNYDRLETLLMGVIFLAAVVFVIRHFLPGIYAFGRDFFMPEKTRRLGVIETSNTSNIGCQTKCSACNGCSLANKT